MPSVSSNEAPVCDIVAETIPRLLDKTLEDTAKLFETSLHLH